MIIKNYKSIYPVGFIINSLKAAIKWIKVSNERIDVKTAPPPKKKQRPISIFIYQFVQVSNVISISQFVSDRRVLQ